MGREHIPESRPLATALWPRSVSDSSKCRFLVFSFLFCLRVGQKETARETQEAQGPVLVAGGVRQLIGALFSAFFLLFFSSAASSCPEWKRHDREMGWAGLYPSWEESTFFERVKRCLDLFILVLLYVEPVRASFHR